MSAEEPLTLRVAEVVVETPDAVSLVFEVPSQLTDRLRHRPGQYLTVRVPSDRTGSVARSYSLCNLPGDEAPTVTVKRTTDGYASNWICDHVAAGSELTVLPPAGSFVPPSVDGDLLLFAAGSGITPILSILKAALARGTGHVALFYANRDRLSVIFAAALDDLRTRHPDRFEVAHWLEDDRGLPDDAAVLAFARRHPDRPVYACGPRPFLTLVRGALRGDGRAVVMENFVSLRRNPFEEIAGGAPAIPATAPADTPARVMVDLFGEEVELDWPRDTPLLDLLLAKGLDAPYACREATCGSCACRIEAGEVRMRNNDVLDDDDLADGYVLACQSLPVTDEVRVSYE